jgi:hypothetical protein
MAKKVAVAEKKLYRAMRAEGVSKKKAARVIGVISRKPKRSKPTHRVVKPVAALKDTVKKLRPRR